MQKKLFRNNKISIPVWRDYFSPKEQAVFLLILVAAVSVRIWGAYQFQIWRDEAYIILLSRGESFLNLLIQNHWDTAHPPLYFLFLYFWTRLGFSQLLLRAPSIIISVVSLFYLPVLGKKLFPRLVLFPFFFFILIAFSHTQISLQIVARPYPFVILCMILSLIYFLDLIDVKKPEKTGIRLFVTANVIGFFFDYSFVWLLFAYGAYAALLLIQRHRRVGVFIRGLGWTGIICLFWAPFFLRNLSQALHLERHLTPLFDSPNPFSANLFQLPFFAGVTPHDLLVREGLFTLPSLAIISLICGLCGLVYLWYQDKNKGFLIGILFVVSPAISFLLSLNNIPIFVARNLLVVNIALYIIMTFILSTVMKKKLLVLLFSLLIVTHFITTFKMLYYIDPPYDWKRAVRTIQTYSGGQEIFLLTQDETYMFSSLEYYLIKAGIDDLAPHKIQTFDAAKQQERYALFFIDASDRGRAKRLKDYYQLSKRIKCDIEVLQDDYIYLSRCLFRS